MKRLLVFVALATAASLLPTLPPAAEAQSGPTIQLLYVVPYGVTPPYTNAEMNARIPATVDAVQDFLQADVGRQLRVQPGVTRVFVHNNSTQNIRDQLLEQGFNDPNKIYLAFAETIGSGGSCGLTLPAYQGDPAYAFLLMPTCNVPDGIYPAAASAAQWPYGATYLTLHELIHALGAVASCAPNEGNGSHVTDSAYDVIFLGGRTTEQWNNLTLDVNNDDYYGHSNAGCVDIEDSPYWTSAPTGRNVVDVDGDGFDGPLGDGSDCDDTNPGVNPNATEVPGNGIDEDCDGADAPAPTGPTCVGRAITVDLNAAQAPTEGPDVILGTPGDDIIDGLGGDDYICSGGGSDTVNGGPGDDYVRAGAGDDTVNGGDGDDRLFGVAGDDTMNGDAGNDTLHGNRGADTLDGGPGDDRLFGYADNDTINGGDGNDRILGHFGHDTIDGGPGDDRLFGFGDNDTINGGPGNDLISGNFGDDIINGGQGNDSLFGSDGADQVNGNAGNDLVNGNSSNDTLSGGGGNDTLDGGINTDTCNGNSGTDTASRCESVTGIP